LRYVPAGPGVENGLVRRVLFGVIRIECSVIIEVLLDHPVALA
jgi:hypothetical protein